MAQLWYYVEDGERVGPISSEEIGALIQNKKLTKETYVWTKGFADWLHLGEVKELEVFFREEAATSPIIKELEKEASFVEPTKDQSGEIEKKEKEEEEVELEELFLGELNTSHGRFYIKTGADRGGVESEYGPFSLDQLKILFEQERINERTYIYTGSMAYWRALGSFADFNSLFNQDSEYEEPKKERRKNLRKPFVARMFFTDRKDIFEGLCRDISIGGMQILLDHYPGAAGDKMNINVHPENTDYNFMASGVVVRILEGRKGVSFRFVDLSEEAKLAIESYLNEGH